MSFSLLENCSEKEKREIINAVIAEMNTHKVEHVFPTAMSNAEYEAFKLAERQHAPGVTCRMNPVTFRVEYIDAEGRLVE